MGGFGHSPIATPINPATGQPLSPYEHQTAGPAGTLAGGGFGHPANTPVAPLTPTAYAGVNQVGAARNAAFYGGATTPATTPGYGHPGNPNESMGLPAGFHYTNPALGAGAAGAGGATTAPAGGTTFHNQFGSYTVPAGAPYYAQGTQPSNDPGVFTTPSYIRGVNQNFEGQAANINNALMGPAAAQMGGYQSANPQAFNAYWNALTKGGAGFDPTVSPAAYGLPTGIGIPASAYAPGGAMNPNWNGGAGGTAPNYSPANAFSPQGAGSTLPNMFGQGSTGVNSGTNIAGGGGNIFGGPGSAGTGGTGTTGTGTAGVGAGQPGTSGAGMTPDQALAALAGNTGYLTSIAQGGGNPVDASKAWQSAVAAMQQQIQTGAANLAAQFAGSGNLDSSAFGTAMQQYMNQAQLQENALTAQYGFQSATDAQNRLLSAAGQLNTGAQNALSQLSGQAYGATEATQAQQAQAALAMLGYGSGAAQQLSAQSYGAAGQLNNAAIQGALANLQNQQFLQNLGISGASALSQNWNQGLQLGAGLGQQQYVDQQSAINNLYQEFLRTQPQNNPLLQMMYSAITTYPGQAATSYAPPALGSLLQGIGSLLGAGGLSNIGQILKQIGITGGSSNTNIGITPPGTDPTGGSTGGPTTGGY